VASICTNTVTTDCHVVSVCIKLKIEYCKKYCNTDLEKTIAISIAIVFPPSIATAIAILFASIANNPDQCKKKYIGLLRTDRPTDDQRPIDRPEWRSQEFV